MTAYAELTTKKARIEHIRNQIATNDRWALRALLAIHKYQTASEKASHSTIDHNGVGFNGADAEILTSFANVVVRRNVVEKMKRPDFNATQVLTEKQIAILRRRMVKYARQLESISTNS